MAVKEDQLRQKLALLEARIGKFEKRERSRWRWRRGMLGALGAVGISAAILWGGEALSDPTSALKCVYEDNLYCFKENTPARASSVNGNFAQLVAWMEQKVGLVNSADIEASNISADNISAGNVTSSTGFHGVGEHGTAYVHFSHKDMQGAGQYALLQSSNGTTFLNAASGQSINIRINNSNKLVIDSAGNATFYGNITRPCPSGYTAQSGFCYSGIKGVTDAHTAQANCSNEGARVCTVGEYYNITGWNNTHPCGSNHSTIKRCWTNTMASGTGGLSVSVGSDWSNAGYTADYQYRCCRMKN